MEGGVRGEGVVTVGNRLHGNFNLEVSLEHEVLEFEYFVVFFDGFGPLGLAELDSSCGNLDGRGLQEFVGGDICVYVPVFGNYDVDGDFGLVRKLACGERHRRLRRLHRVHVELLSLRFGNSC